MYQHEILTHTRLTLYTIFNALISQNGALKKNWIFVHTQGQEWKEQILTRCVVSLSMIINCLTGVITNSFMWQLPSGF